MPYIGKKVQVGFRFSPEVDERLKELAEIWGQTRTAWLEEQILSFDLGSEREAASEHEEAPSVQTPKDAGEHLAAAKDIDEIVDAVGAMEKDVKAVQARMKPPKSEGYQAPRQKINPEKIAAFQRGMGKK